MAGAAEPETEVKDLVFDNLKLHVLKDVIFYGLVSQQSFAAEKA